MTWLVMAFGVLVTVLGLLGVIRPRTLVRFVDAAWRRPSGIWLAVGLRVVLGVALWLAAPQSHYPTALRVLAVIALAAAASVPLLGRERLDRFVAWWMARPIGFVRAWGAIAAAFGVFLIYAVK